MSFEGLSSAKFENRPLLPAILKTGARVVHKLAGSCTELPRLAPVGTSATIDATQPKKRRPTS